MKQFVRSLYAVALASVVMVGCSKDPSAPAQYGNERKIRFTTNIDRPQSVASRVVSSQWEYGDMIGVYMMWKDGAINNADDIVLGSENRLFRVDFKTGNYVPADESQAMFYPLALENPDPAGHDFDFVAYHPYTSKEQMVDYKIPINISANKPVLTATGKSAWPDYQQEGVTIDPVNLSFKHQMARIKLNIHAGEGLIDSDLRAMSVTFVNANAKGEYNVLDNQFEADVELANVDFLVTKNVATAEEKLEGIVVTGSVATLIVIPNTGTKKNDGADYPVSYRSIEFKLRNTSDKPTADTYEIIYPLDDNVVYEPGKEYTYNVTIKRDQVRFDGWEVDEWTPGPEIVVDDEDIMDMDEWKYRRSMYAPNSYIWQSKIRNASTATQTDRLSFPIKKAFGMWRYNELLKDSGIGEIPDLTLTENANKTITAEVIWADDPDVLNYKIAFSDVVPTYKSNINITFERLVPANQTATPMNMLIGLKVGTKQPDGTTVYEDFYRWSWHIWVVRSDLTDPTSAVIIRNYDNDGVRDGGLLPTTDPDYDPLDLKGFTYEYVFMARNLGSKLAFTSNGVATLDDVNSLGLYYQWGRPTPFPGPANLDATEFPKLYTVRAKELIELTTTNDGLLGTIDGEQISVLDVVKDPSKFVTSSSGNWISPSMNAQLWTDAKKSPWDPCPDEWRVPAYTNKYHPEIPLSPWNNPQLILPPTGPVDPEVPIDPANDPTQTPATDTDPTKYMAVFKNDATSKGYNFAPTVQSKSRFRQGWYPAAGYRSGANGTMTQLGTAGYNWTSTLSNAGEQQFFYTDAANVNPYAKQANFSANAAPVRCVKMQ